MVKLPEGKPNTNLFPWGFPKIWVPPNHPWTQWIFLYKPSILGTPFMEPPKFTWLIDAYWLHTIYVWQNGGGLLVGLPHK